MSLREMNQTTESHRNRLTQSRLPPRGPTEEKATRECRLCQSCIVGHFLQPQPRLQDHPALSCPRRYVPPWLLFTALFYLPQLGIYPAAVPRSRERHPRARGARALCWARCSFPQLPAGAAFAAV